MNNPKQSLLLLFHLGKARKNIEKKITRFRGTKNSCHIYLEFFHKVSEIYSNIFIDDLSYISKKLSWCSSCLVQWNGSKVVSSGITIRSTELETLGKNHGCVGQQTDYKILASVSTAIKVAEQPSGLTAGKRCSHTNRYYQQ